MKAIVVPGPGGPEALVYAEAPDPVTSSSSPFSPGRAIVKVKATAVNRADLLQAQGKYPPPPGEPDILGLEMAGVVETVAPGLGIATGDRVFALLGGGGYAEKVSVDTRLLMPIPAEMSFTAAAAIPEAFFTAYLNLFWEAGLKQEETVLIHAGASGVGTSAIQLSRFKGATVLATAGSPEKLQACRKLGAHAAFDYKTEDVASRVRETTAALGRDGVDVILDPVGGPSTASNLSLLRTGGRYVLIATMGGGKAEIDLRTILTRRLRLIGSTLRSRPIDEKARLTEAFASECLPAFSRGSLRPVIDSVFPLAQAADAHRRMAANLNIGKIVLTVP